MPLRRRYAAPGMAVRMVAVSASRVGMEIELETAKQTLQKPATASQSRAIGFNGELGLYEDRYSECERTV